MMQSNDGLGGTAQYVLFSLSVDKADETVQEHVRLMTESHPDAQGGGSGISVLNVGYGLGIVSHNPLALLSTS